MGCFVRIRARVLPVFAAVLLVVASGGTLTRASISQVNAVGSTPGQFAVGGSGAATYTIPIVVPPGTNGMQPSLSLVYSSHGANGLLGVGWALGGISTIQRCGASLYLDGFKGGVYFDERDRFCLDGQRLIFDSQTNSYRTQHETWQKIVVSGGTSSNPESFVIYSKDGSRRSYSGIKASAPNDAINKLWVLAKVVDTNENYFTISYGQDLPNGEYWPSRIDYTGNGNTGLQPYNYIEFQYEARPDVVTTYAKGSKSRLSQRISHIVARAATESGIQTVRVYHFEYDQSGPSQRSRLVKVQECGVSGTCLKPTEISWLTTSPDAGLQSEVQYAAPTLIYDYDNLNDFGVDLIDLNGDGLDDYVHARWKDGSLEAGAYLNTGTGWASAPNYAPRFAIVKYYGKDLGSHFVDLNGDGLVDQVHARCAYVLNYCADDGSSAAYLNTGAGWQSAPNYRPPYHLVDSDGKDRGGRFEDLDGDGLVDLIYGRFADGSLSTGAYRNTGSGWEPMPAYALPYQIVNKSGESADSHLVDINGDGLVDFVYVWTYTGTCWINFGKKSIKTTCNQEAFGAYINTGTGWQPASNLAPRVRVMSKDGSRFVDLNGDGLQDLVVTAWSNDETPVPVNSAYLNTGTGWQLAPDFAPPRSLSGAPGEGGSKTEFRDINGDGLLDFISNSEDSVAYLNTGSGWQIAPNFAPQACLDRFGTRIADLNGDGIDDLVCSYKTAGFAGLLKSRVINFAYTSSAGYSDVVDAITSGLGVQTKIDYRPLTDAAVYTKTADTDPSSIYPYQDVQDATYVVASVSTSNGIGGTNTTNYKYGGVRIHQTANANLGFRWTDTTDATGLRSIKRFNQVLDGTEGTLLADNTWAGNVRVKHIYNTWTAISTGPGVTQALLSSQYEETRELNDTPVSHATTTSVYDQYGYPTQIVVEFSDQYKKTTTNTYSHDSALWRFGRLTRAEVTAVAPGGDTQTRTSAFTYTASGQVESETIEPGNAALELTTSYTYNGLGNRLTKTVSGSGIGSRLVETLTYTPGTGQFVQTRANALGHLESYTHDARWGAKTSQTGPNGLTTRWTYDGLGRQIREDRADNTFTALEYQSQPSGYATRTTASGAGESWVFYDILGRKLRTAAQGFGGNWIYQDTTYNNIGRVIAVSHPYFDGETAHPVTTTYDILGRVLSVTQPGDGNRTVTTVYEGACTTSTNPLGQQKQICNNTQGKMVSATDAGGTTSYLYDAYSNLTQVTDPVGNRVTMQYDRRGRKIAMNDPDMGAWTYSYNILGELVSQRDAKGQTVTMTYDVLSRMRQRSASEGTSTWTYDTAAMGIGKLAEMKNPAGDLEVYTYDDKGRPGTVKTVIGGEEFVVTTGYDANSRVETVTYPKTGYKMRNVYDNYGHLWQVLDVTGNPSLVWQIGPGGLDAHGRVSYEQFGNGVEGRRNYNHETGDLDGIRTTGPQGGVQNLDYVFDAIGNLKSRADNVMGFSESFTYDNLNRLTAVAGPSSKTIQYDGLGSGSIGNITYKSDVGIYAYPLPGGVRPHAVASITDLGGSVSNFSYDANGNLLSGMGRTVTYTSFNKPASVRNASGQTSYFTYDANDNRIRKATPTTTTLYVGKLYEKTIRNGTTIEHKHYVYAGKMLVAMHTEQSGGGTVSAPRTQYVHSDHLGSVNVITDESGNVVERLSYDAHGKRRNANGTDMASPTSSQVTTRGFTGHEHDDEIGLINMNARLYDPVIGRFLTPDTFVQFPDHSQGLNRYSYVNNNPLSYSDPSGHFLKRLFGFGKRLLHKTADFVRRTGKKHGRLIVMAVIAYYTYGAISTAVQSSMEAVAGACFTAAPAEAVVAGSAASGFISGGIAGGDFRSAFRGGVFGAVSGAAFYGADAAGQDWGWYGRTSARGVAGGFVSEMQGGDFQNGFRMSFLTTVARDSYHSLVGDSVVGYDARGKSLGTNTFGLAHDPRVSEWDDYLEEYSEPLCNSVLCEKSDLMVAVSRIPLMHAISGLHDWFTGTTGYGPRIPTGWQADVMDIPVAGSFVYNVATMGIAATWTAAAYVAESRLDPVVIGFR